MINGDYSIARTRRRPNWQCEKCIICIICLLRVCFLYLLSFDWRKKFI